MDLYRFPENVTVVTDEPRCFVFLGVSSALAWETQAKRGVLHANTDHRDSPSLFWWV